MLKSLEIKHFLKIAFFIPVVIYMSGCGRPDPSEWYSYRNRDRHPVSVRVVSAEILPGSETKDKIQLKVEWRNDDKEKIKINDEYFSLNVSGVKLPPETFEDIELDPGQTVEKVYDFFVVKSFVDKAKYKLTLEDYVEFSVYPERK